MKFRGIDVGRIAAGDQRIGVGRVADDENTNIPTGMVTDRSALYGKNSGVCLQQILAFHTRAARSCAHQQRIVAVLEGDIRVVGGDDTGECRERAVVEFHDHALQGGQRGRNFEQLQNDRLVTAQQLA